MENLMQAISTFLIDNRGNFDTIDAGTTKDVLLSDCCGIDGRVFGVVNKPPEFTLRRGVKLVTSYIPEKLSNGQIMGWDGYWLVTSEHAIGILIACQNTVAEPAYQTSDKIFLIRGGRGVQLHGIDVDQDSDQVLVAVLDALQTQLKEENFDVVTAAVKKVLMDHNLHSNDFLTTDDLQTGIFVPMLVHLAQINDPKAIWSVSRPDEKA